MNEEQAKEYFLKTANTKHLLSILRRTHCTSHYYNGLDNLATKESKISFLSKGGVYHIIYLTKNELKNELSKRKHIPNSIESRKLRQKLAKKYRKGFQGKKDR